MARTSYGRAQTGVEYILIIASIIFLAVLVFIVIRGGVLMPGESTVRNNSVVFTNYITCGYNSVCGCANQPCCGDACSPQYYCRASPSPKTCVGR